MNQRILTATLVISGIYTISQKITDLEIESGKGNLIGEEVLNKAGDYISQATARQTFILRLGMVIIPIDTILGCYLLLRKKYKIDEKEYDRILSEIEKEKAAKVS